MVTIIFKKENMGQSKILGGIICLFSGNHKKSIGKSYVGAGKWLYHCQRCLISLDDDYHTGLRLLVFK